MNMLTNTYIRLTKHDLVTCTVDRLTSMKSVPMDRLTNAVYNYSYLQWTGLQAHSLFLSTQVIQRRMLAINSRGEILPLLLIFANLLLKPPALT